MVKNNFAQVVSKVESPAANPISTCRPNRMNSQNYSETGHTMPFWPWSKFPPSRTINGLYDTLCGFGDVDNDTNVTKLRKIKVAIVR